MISATVRVVAGEFPDNALSAGHCVDAEHNRQAGDQSPSVVGKGGMPSCSMEECLMLLGGSALGGKCPCSQGGVACGDTADMALVFRSETPSCDGLLLLPLPDRYPLHSALPQSTPPRRPPRARTPVTRLGRWIPASSSVPAAMLIWAIRRSSMANMLHLGLSSKAWMWSIG